MTSSIGKTRVQLLAENDELRVRLDEAEDTLRAIRSGEVDALIVSGVGGEQIFRLKGTDQSYRLLIEEMNEGALTLTAQGVILFANRSFAEMLKAPLETVIGSTIYTWISPDSLSSLQAHLCKNKDQAHHEELVLNVSDGSQLVVYISMNKLCIDNMPDSFCLVVTDMSDQKQLEEQLRVKNAELEAQNRRIQEANRLKSEFLANMSHELRTPLNGIIGFAELMHNGKVGPISAEHKEYLGDILACSKHLLQLINDVLDLAKVESGKMEFHPEPVDLVQLIDEVRDILRTMISKKQIKLDVVVDSKIDDIIIDPAKLKQVLYNYVSNALKFTPDKGRIHIRIIPEGKDNFRLEIQDAGIGIRDEDLGRLFVEFQQLDASIAKKYQGTGLGLSLTRRIVEAQGGEVGVNSIFGKGSTFYAILPKKPHNTNMLEQNPKGILTSAPYNAPSILVIEDDSKDRAILINTLTKAGYSVDTAVNGAEAIQRARERKFEAITLNLLLPDKSGWDILREIRAQGKNKDIPVIVVTVVTEKSASCGFMIHDFLVKPIEPSELLAALKRAKVLPYKTTNTVLVIDDDKNALKLAQHTLNAEGYETICSLDGATGLRAATEIIPDIIVLDLLMPGMNGFEFLKKFRATKNGKRTPVIVWTVKDLTEDERTTLQASAQSIVLKGENEPNNLLLELQHFLPLSQKIKSRSEK